MVLLEILLIPGFLLLLFRAWLVEVKLQDELQFRRRYFSRFFSYYTCLALAFGLGAFPLNIMVMIAFPILLVTSIWDINFYRRFRFQSYWTKNRRWLIVERITLHPPVVMVAVYMILTDAKNYIQPPNLVVLLIGTLILFSPFFVLDKRWTHRYKWPQALTVIGLMAASTIGLMFAEAFLWGVPLW